MTSWWSHLKDTKRKGRKKTLTWPGIVSNHPCMPSHGHPHSHTYTHIPNTELKERQLLHSRVGETTYSWKTDSLALYMGDAWSWASGFTCGARLSERTTTQDGCLVLSTPTLRVVNDLPDLERGTVQGGWIYDPSEKRAHKRGIWTKGKKLKITNCFGRVIYIFSIL